VDNLNGVNVAILVEDGFEHRDVAWWAHVGGFTAGIILHFFFVKRKDEYPRQSRDEYGPEVAWMPANYWRTSR
jgi:membrane associated rhomboid family serine protease